MIGYLEGSIKSNLKNPAIVMVSGVGYQVYLTPQLVAKTPEGSLINLYIYTSVKEDAIELYGFKTENEYNLFSMLLSVSGIGPKTALLVVDRGEKLVKKAVIDSDVDFFTNIPRLGKKNAQKIIIELKSKIGSEKELDLTYAQKSQTGEIMEALLSMGFAKPEIAKALGKINESDDTPEKKIKTALKYLGK